MDFPGKFQRQKWREYDPEEDARIVLEDIMKRFRADGETRMKIQDVFVDSKERERVREILFKQKERVRENKANDKLREWVIWLKDQPKSVLEGLPKYQQEFYVTHINRLRK